MPSSFFNSHILAKKQHERKGRKNILHWHADWDQHLNFTSKLFDIGKLPNLSKYLFLIYKMRITLSLLQGWRKD